MRSLTTLQLRADAGRLKPHRLHLNARTSLHMVTEHGTREPHHHDHLCNIAEGDSLVSLPDYGHASSCSEENKTWPGNLGRLDGTTEVVCSGSASSGTRLRGYSHSQVIGMW